MPCEVAVTLTSTSSGSGGFAWTRLWSFFFPVRSSSSSSVVEKGGGGATRVWLLQTEKPKAAVVVPFSSLNVQNGGRFGFLFTCARL